MRPRPLFPFGTGLESRNRIDGQRGPRAPDTDNSQEGPAFCNLCVTLWPLTAGR